MDSGAFDGGLSERIVDKQRRIFDAAHIRQTQIDAAGKKFADDMVGVDSPYGRVSWYVVGVRAGREQAVFDVMSDSGVDVLLPKRTKEIVENPKRRSNKSRFIDVPAFSGYLFVRLWPLAEAWHGICGFETWFACLVASKVRCLLRTNILAKSKALTGAQPCQGRSGIWLVMLFM